MGVAVSVLVFALALATQAAPPKDVRADVTKPFSHDTHLSQLRTVAGKERRYSCSDCHTLKAVKDEASKTGVIPRSQDGERGKAYPICASPRMPFPAHDKCIGCHASAFFKPPIVICTNCHVDVKITEKSPLKEQTSAQAPLRTEFSHLLHLDPTQRVRKKFKMEKDCSFCHRFVRGGEKVLLPEHPQCCECHTQQDVEPNINDCAGCHSRPRSEPNPASMVKKFSHAQHKTDPATNQSLGCLRCHFEVPRSQKIATLILPKMATCVECHQGELAFSYAECLKCHEKGIEARLVPPTHKIK